MTLKTALVAPIPRARESTAVSANPGRLRNSRPAYRKSAKSDSMVTSSGAGLVALLSSTVTFYDELSSREVRPIMWQLEIKAPYPPQSSRQHYGDKELTAVPADNAG